VNVIKCLYVDDEVADLKKFARFFRNAWERLHSELTLEVTLCSSADEARALIEHTRYDIFLVDIMFGDDDTAGLEIIREARTAVPDAAVIAISVRSDRRQDAIDVGADELVVKPYISSRDVNGEYLERVIRSVLKARGRDVFVAADVVVHYDDRDSRLMTDIEDIGEQHLAALTVGVVGSPCTQIDLERVRPGFSGSIVMRAVCHLRTAPAHPPDVRDLLLKITRERELLTLEMARWEVMNSFPSGLFVTVIGREVVEVGGWCAIGAQFKSRARTAFDWLLQPDVGGDTVRSMLHWLFIESGLPEVYARQKVDDDRRPNEAILSLLSRSRRARIRTAVEEFGSLASKHGGASYNEESLNALLRANRFGGIDEASVMRGTRSCRSHGDLHARNVLVGVRDHPQLIDPANIGPLPIYADLARFTADVLIGGWDAGDASHYPAHISRWVHVVAAFVAGESLSSAEVTATNTNVAAAVEFLRANRTLIYGGIDVPWQWQLLTAVEFLRCSYRGDLSAPKRALALLGGCMAIRKAAELFEAADR
jgi:CheY-like chemotaxis protein